MSNEGATYSLMSNERAICLFPNEDANYCYLWVCNNVDVQRPSILLTPKDSVRTPDDGAEY